MLNASGSRLYAGATGKGNPLAPFQRTPLLYLCFYFYFPLRPS